MIRIHKGGWNRLISEYWNEEKKDRDMRKDRDRF
jgi:hypothetical protein